MSANSAELSVCATWGEGYVSAGTIHGAEVVRLERIACTRDLKISGREPADFYQRLLSRQSCLGLRSGVYSILLARGLELSKGINSLRLVVKRAGWTDAGAYPDGAVRLAT